VIANVWISPDRRQVALLDQFSAQFTIVNADATLPDGVTPEAGRPEDFGLTTDDIRAEWIDLDGDY